MLWSHLFWFCFWGFLFVYKNQNYSTTSSPPLQWWEPGRGLEDVSCALSSRLGHSLKLHKTLVSGTSGCEEAQKEDKLYCSKQPKHCSEAQGSNLPRGSTSRCYTPPPQKKKENCHWEKELCFLVFNSSYFSLSLFFWQKNKTHQRLLLISAICLPHMGPGAAQVSDHREFPPSSKLSATKGES